LIFVVQKKKCTVGQRSFSTGIIAECMEPLGFGQIPTVAGQLLPLLSKLAGDKESDVRNNSIFALGEMALHGKDCVFP
jgi:importin-4